MLRCARAKKKWGKCGVADNNKSVETYILFIIYPHTCVGIYFMYFLLNLIKKLI